MLLRLPPLPVQLRQCQQRIQLRVQQRRHDCQVLSARVLDHEGEPSLDGLLATLELSVLLFLEKLGRGPVHCHRPSRKCCLDDAHTNRDSAVPKAHLSRASRGVRCPGRSTRDVYAVLGTPWSNGVNQGRSSRYGRGGPGRGTSTQLVRLERVKDAP